MEGKILESKGRKIDASVQPKDRSLLISTSLRHQTVPKMLFPIMVSAVIGPIFYSNFAIQEFLQVDNDACQKQHPFSKRNAMS